MSCSLAQTQELRLNCADEAGLAKGSFKIYKYMTMAAGTLIQGLTKLCGQIMRNDTSRSDRLVTTARRRFPQALQTLDVLLVALDLAIQVAGVTDDRDGIIRTDPPAVHAVDAAVWVDLHPDL